MSNVEMEVTRPIFVAERDGPSPVAEIPVRFLWTRGTAAEVKARNVAALHAAARSRGFECLLEASTKSPLDIGRRLSAFNLVLRVGDRDASLESAYQASKVFADDGPFADLIDRPAVEAKRDRRLRASGALISFAHAGERFPVKPKTVFYDWLYLQAARRCPDLIEAAAAFGGYTDIEFDPARSVNCQARALATIVGLMHRGQLDLAADSFASFRRLAGHS